MVVLSIWRLRLGPQPLKGREMPEIEFKDMVYERTKSPRAVVKKDNFVVSFVVPIRAKYRPLKALNEL